MFTDEERKSAETQAEKQARSMKLNVVRLCFQACLLNNSGVVTKVLEAVISDPIYDSSKSSYFYRGSFQC